MEAAAALLAASRLVPSDLPPRFSAVHPLVLDINGDGLPDLLVQRVKGGEKGAEGGQSAEGGGDTVGVEASNSAPGGGIFMYLNDGSGFVAVEWHSLLSAGVMIDEEAGERDKKAGSPAEERAGGGEQATNSDGSGVAQESLQQAGDAKGGTIEAAGEAVVLGAHSGVDEKGRSEGGRGRQLLSGSGESEGSDAKLEEKQVFESSTLLGFCRHQRRLQIGRSPGEWR